jgi:hypothetical protein
MTDPERVTPGEGERPKRAKILGRIAAQNGLPGISDKLSQLPTTDLQSVLLDVYDQKASRRGVPDILRNLREETYIQPSVVDQRDFIQFDSAVCKYLPDNFRVLDLSPIVPFAINDVLADINQNRVFSTTRNSEIMSDPTMALAVQCFSERRALLLANPRSTATVALATSQRVIRQEAKKKAEYSQHFRSFSLVTAGRDTGHGEFEQVNTMEHIGVFLAALEELSSSGNYAFKDIVVKLSETSHDEELTRVLVDSIVPQLQLNNSDATVLIDDERQSNYYDSICYSIYATPEGGDKPVSIAGGGMVGWSQKLASVKKERMIIGAIGSETICRHFKK